MSDALGAVPGQRREYLIDHLAQAAGTTVRNVRAYQDRGLLPRADRRGRANVYDDTHLERLRLIAGLLDRGHTLAGIKELLDAWEDGRSLGGVLGLVAEVTAPWSDEQPEYLERAELTARFGGLRDPEAIAAAIRLGVLVPEPQHPAQPGQVAAMAGTQAGEPLAGSEGQPWAFGGSEGQPQARAASERQGQGPAGAEGLPSALVGAVRLPPQATGSVLERGGWEEPLADRYRVPSPALLDVAARLYELGVPLAATIAHLQEVRTDVEHLARRFVHFAAVEVFPRYVGAGPLDDADAARAAEAVRRLRPLAQAVVDAELARAMRNEATLLLEASVASLPEPVRAALAEEL
ncbi:MerR family transcriptional regulator [Streptacidiphilus pinicola]|uniref:MerR family transcriptional regulator n=1 Tax=Streptacidiphilus pinicola TaxID=2219663 RepID=UPI001FB4334A|nr:MerR family transcriptional regulator [Streptacidiphilus pinicola]